MTIRTIALGAVLLLTGAAFADKNHTIREGDTLSAIAGRYGVSQKAIQQANGLSNAHRLKVGASLRIPTNDRSSKKGKAAKSTGSGNYSVRSGDNDWVIAKRFQTTPSKIRSLNPSVNWGSLQIGQKIRVPGGTTKTAVASKSSAKVSTAGGKYTVKAGDNDWIIAKRVGTTPSVIRSLNPSIRWNKLQIGQAIRVPGGQTVASASRPTLRSKYAVVTGDSVTVRRKPSTNGAKVTTVTSGTKVVVLDHESGWYKLQFPKGTTGWVRGDLLKASTAPTSKKIDTVAARKTSTAKKTIVASKKPSTKVAMRSSSATSQTLLEKARSFQGVRYRYGAMSRSATDCSGFTTQVFRSVGVKLPRTAAQQAKVGASVPKTQLKAGDLVFFRTSRGPRISHVGIYVGSGKFIHASSGGGKVMTSSLTEGYYKNRYAGARRVAKLKVAEVVAEAKKEVDVAPKVDTPITPQIDGDEISR